MNKSVFIAAAMAILLLSAVAELATDTTGKYPNLFVYGATSTFGGRAPNINVTIVMPDEGEAYSKNVLLIINIQAPEGYSLEYHAILFEEYLFAEALIDCEREEVINALNVDYGEQSYRYQIFSINGSIKIPLSYSEGSYYGNVTLPELPEGTHNLMVWVRAEQNMMSFSPLLWTALSDTVTFTVDFTAPRVSVVSPEAKVYNASDVPLDFTVNEAFSQISYSLDGHENVTATGNIMLTLLSNGAHNVTVYAWDEVRNVGASETVTFSVDVPEPFPTALVMTAFGVSLAVVGIGLLVYFKKRKHHTVSQGILTKV